MKYNLTPKQSKFARYLFEGKTQIESYKLSYDAGNMTDAAIANEASKLAANPEIVAFIEQMTRDAEYVAQLNVGWVLRRYMEIATADVNELIESRRVCCRHCHGVNHAYQWVDAEEWALALAKTLEGNERRRKAWRGKQDEAPPDDPLPTSDGGFGFWGTNPPVETCPKCFGNGEMQVHVHDTRKLSPGAKILYAGIKQTANGIEVKTRDQDGALAFLAKYLGLDKKTLELQGPGGGPVQSITALTTDPVEAAKTYAAIMSGKP